MTEPSNPSPLKLRDWPMFQASRGKEHRRPAPSDGRRLPTISDLLTSRMQGPPAEKLAWLRSQKAAGKLAGDDPGEVAEAEALFEMLDRLANSKKRKDQGRHLDELLDEGLKATFPASDPVAVGHFTGTEEI